MAREARVSKSIVQRIWSHNEIKPHRLERFKISNDPNFEEKFWDVIGLYLDPPERALVVCCDEKSQCQALKRTQRPLPLKKGYVRSQTHDYIRHGTITLFAALSYLEGKIISRTEESHIHIEPDRRRFTWLSPGTNCRTSVLMATWGSVGINRKSG